MSDLERGKRLVETICDLSQDDPQVTDYDFGFMVRRVGAAMSKNATEDYLAAGADLAEYLIGDRPIGPGERRELALLVLGTDRRPQGRPEMHPEHPKVKAVVADYRAAVEAGIKGMSAESATAAKFGIKPRTVQLYLQMVKDREAVQARFAKKDER